MGKYGYYASSILDLLTGFTNWPAVVKIFLMPESASLTEGEKKRQVVKLRRNKLLFRVRGKMDVWSVKEAVINRFYSPKGFEPQPGWTIIDIGAGIGEFTLEAAKSQPGCRVFAFEPFADSYNLLVENLTLNGVENVQAFQLAVWAQSGWLELDTSRGEPLQFTSQAAGDPNTAVQGNRVRSVSLADVLETNQIPRVDLLKLDCEGAEYSIILGTDRETFACIDRIVMEYHDLIGGHHHDSLVVFLRDQGYQVRTETNQVHPDLGYLFANR